ncbi:hypothetical protein [Jannaschia sp. R86511]|uniref:hypothetical protein n=1 Tax=Jannaschia sp. R86511 TaxID=3093853 RepID=UPI0036D3AFF9
MATLLFLLILTVFLVALGRDAAPPVERLLLPGWAWQDLAATVLLGVWLLTHLDTREHRQLDVYLDEFQPPAAPTCILERKLAWSAASTRCRWQPGGRQRCSRPVDDRFLATSARQAPF